MDTVFVLAITQGMCIECAVRLCALRLYLSLNISFSLPSLWISHTKNAVYTQCTLLWCVHLGECWSWRLCLCDSPANHRERRNYLRHALSELELILGDQPGLLGPKVLHLCVSNFSCQMTQNTLVGLFEFKLVYCLFILRWLFAFKGEFIWEWSLMYASVRSIKNGLCIGQDQSRMILYMSGRLLRIVFCICVWGQLRRLFGSEHEVFTLHFVLCFSPRKTQLARIVWHYLYWVLASFLL